MPIEGGFVRQGAFRVVLALAVVGVALLAAGCGKKSSSVTPLPSATCGPIQYKRHAKPDKVIASDSPLKGANRSLPAERSKPVSLRLAQHWVKAVAPKI